MVEIATHTHTHTHIYIYIYIYIYIIKCRRLNAVKALANTVAMVMGLLLNVAAVVD